ncbi:ATP-dependent zinc metalloprotease FtsH [Chloroflexota bacterium]
MINWRRSGIFYIIIIALAVFLLAYVIPNSNPPQEIPLSQAVLLSESGQIAEIEVDGAVINITRTDGTELVTFKEEYTSIYDIEGLILENIEVNVKGSTGINWGSLAFNFLPLLLFGGLIFFLFRQARGANSQATSFGRSRARLFPANRTTVTFDDVAGVEEAKQDLQEVVDFLKSRDKFQAIGARIPKGVLLIGPPGTGKTLMARAVAGEADVPFFSISGSEFVEMFVGVGASRVRDLFDQAKRNSPCIVFIDEIDAVGRQRGAGLGGSHDEREQTLNQILVEMDGFDTSTSVIIIAATNRPDILDPALLRPGRFDRRVILDKPDIVGRTAVLKVHTNGKPLEKAVNLEVLAKQTVGLSGADLANLVNEAAILAARRNKKTIGPSEFEEAIDRVIAGPERRSRKISQKEKEVTAYHEAGHALIAKILPNADPVHKISIVARGMSLGHTRQLPIEDRYTISRAEILDMIAILLGGRTAEEIVFNEIASGASDDIKRATSLATRMVTDLGMSDKLGPRTFGDKQEMVFLGREISEQKDYSDATANKIDEEVNRIIEEAHKTAWKVLTDNMDKLKMIAAELIARETIEGEDLDAIMDGKKPKAKRAKPKSTKTPAPVKSPAEVEMELESKKAPKPKLVPEQRPAPSE